MSLKSLDLLKIIITLLVFIFFVLCVDILFQIVYRIVKNEYTWESIDRIEVFHTEYFIPTTDERYIVPQGGYGNSQIQFDEYGFRMGNNMLSTKDRNVVFLGDSVPFGFGANADDTIPSRFSYLMKEDGNDTPTINAAAPSYSLNQAVYRYIYDIENKFPVSTIVLQIYDPADNFSRLEHDWDVSQNWYTTAGNKKVVKKHTLQIFRHSSLFYIYWKHSGFYFHSTDNPVHYNEEDIQRYKNSIILSLDTLLAHADGVDNIILLPITIPKRTMQSMELDEKRPIDILNDIFSSYASNHEKTSFLDTRLLFQKHDDEEIFIDTCCHLTPKGLNMQAEYIKDHILKLSMSIQ